MAINALWRGKKFFTQAYPLIGARSSGTANITVDMLRQGLGDATIDQLSVHLVGNMTVAGAGPGLPTGQFNPQGLITLTTQTTAPQAAGLIPLNAVSSRTAVVDYGVINRQFPVLTQLTDVAGTRAVDIWLHFPFKRDTVRKGIEFGHPLNKWKSDVVQCTFGTRDQLFTGGVNTWDLTAVTVEFWANLDVDADPENIHAVELFEQVYNITASNPSFLINNLPQGVFYDNIYLIAEDNLVLTDGIINNIDIESGGRIWLPQGESNASPNGGFIRQAFTRPIFFDPNQNLTGLYVIPLRDGLWSRALDAVSLPLVITLNVTSLSALSVVRLGGRKIVPGAIKKTIRGPNNSKVVSGLPNA